ncbi:MAG TPA: N-6 DNA methylase [Polyangia bacterium]|nr:N-6 DNA methylase [Polyangia bacterium]
MEKLPSTLDEAYSAVARLVHDFQQNEAAHREPSYSEAAVRKDYIDKVLKAFGWDVDHDFQKNPFEQEIHVERSVNVSGRAKRCDYAFFVSPDFRRERLFVEAKKPAKGLDQADDFFQTIRYAWGRQVPISILTDFAELHVLDCRATPNISTARSRSVERFTYTDLLDRERFARLYWLISREAVSTGSIDKYAAALPKPKRKKGAPLAIQQRSDEAFLDALDNYRLVLAKAFKASNPDLDSAALTEATQRILDRLIFLRFLEDKLIEADEHVLHYAQTAGGSAWESFRRDSHKLDTQYNGIVFKRHFIDADTFSPPADDSFRNVCKDLSDPYSPYNFDAIGIDVLGSIYERFLGKVVIATAKHAHIDFKPEIKKAGGVYYTPQYVVRYIVNKTVGAAVADHNPEYISGIRIADFSCGSGSFLLGAYDYLIDYHAKYYRKFPGQTQADDLTVQSDGTPRLSLKKKREILLNNIFGLDLDPQAVEVTQLSLFLKLLDAESISTTKQARLAFKEAVLPSLSKNIICGNGIVETDVLRKVDFDPDEEREQRPTDLEVVFADPKRGEKFDVVLGNPPWGADIREKIAPYLAEKYGRVVVRMPDTYLYFIARSLHFLRPGSYFGMILPGTLLTQSDARRAREVLLGDTALTCVVNLGEGVFGRKVLNTSAVIVAEKGKNPRKTLTVGDFGDIDPAEREATLQDAQDIPSKKWLTLVTGDPDRTFYTKELPLVGLLQRLQGEHPKLESMLEGEVQRGVTPDLLEMVTVSGSDVAAMKLESEALRPLVLGRHVRRYGTLVSDDWLIYLTRTSKLSHYPNVSAHMGAFRSQLTCSEIRQGKHPWYALHRPRDEAIFRRAKFIGLTTTRSVELVYDPDGKYYPTDALYVFSMKPSLKIAPEVVLAVMQSRLFRCLYQVQVQGEQRVIPQIKASKLAQLPFAKDPTPGVSTGLVADVNAMKDCVSRLDRVRTDTERGYLESRKSSLEVGIDRRVYDLYGLTPEEISLVEAFQPT